MTHPPKTILIANAIFPCTEDEIFHRCYLCDSSQSYDDSLQHISTRNHAERLKKFETAFVNRDADNFICKICDRIFHWKFLKCHATEHEILPWYKPPELYKIFHENQILEFFGKFYCYPCDEISHNWSVAIVHTNDEKHKEKQLEAKKSKRKILNLSGSILPYKRFVNNGIFTCSDENIGCKICDCSNIGIKNFDQHVRGFRHKDKKFKLSGALNNRVSRKMADERTIENRNDSLIEVENDFEQVPCCSNGHESCRLNLAANGDESKIETHQPITSDIRKKPLDGAITEKNPLSRDYIVEQSETDFFCIICNLKTTSKCDFQGHVSSKRHTKRLDNFHDNGIILMKNNHFYCNYCHLEFQDLPRIWNHIDSKAHKSSRLDKPANIAKSNFVTVNGNNVSKKNKELPIKSVLPNLPIDGAISVQKMLYQNLIVKYNDKDFYCSICNLMIIDWTNVRNHITTKVHVENREKFRENKITFRDEKYHCEFCLCKIDGFDNVFHHVNGNRHSIAISNNQELSKNQEILNNGVVREKNKMPYHYIVESNDTKDPYCKICDCKIGGYVNIEQHVGGFCHDSAMTIFNVNKIKFLKNNDYTCNYCNCKLTGNSCVRQHIGGTRHLGAVQRSKEPKNLGAEVSELKDLKQKNAKDPGPKDLKPKVIKAEGPEPKDINQKDPEPKNLKAKDPGPKDQKPKDLKIEGPEPKDLKSKDQEPKVLKSKDPDPKDRKPKDPGPKNQKLKDQKPKDLNTEGPDSKDLKPKDPEPKVLKPKDPEPKDRKSKDLKPKDSGPKDPNDQKPKDPVPKHLRHSICTLFTLASRKGHQQANDITKSKDQELPKIEKTTNNTDASKIELPYHYIVETNEPKYPYCKICDCMIGGYVNIQQHVSGLRHAHAMRLFNVNKIEFLENDDYNCDYCNCKITGNRRIHGHIGSTKHLDAVQRSKESMILKPKIPKPKDPEPKNLKPECSVPKDPGPKKLMPEVTVPKYPKKPLTALFNLSSDRVNENGHNIARSKNQELPKIETITNNVITTKQKLPYHYIIEFNETHAYCKICDCPIGGYVNIEQHVAGLRHAQASRIFNENKIEFKEKDIYHCKYCNCKIYSNSTVKRHIEGYRHLSSLNKSNDLDSNDPKLNFSKLQASKSNFSKPKIISKQQSSENLTHEYIVKINYTDSLCKICNCVILWGQRSVNQHLAGKSHAASLRKYGCDNITLVVPATRDYYCKSCDCRVRGDGQIWRHAIGPKHAKSIISCNNNNELGRDNEIIDKSKNFIKLRILRRSMKNGKSSNSMNSGRANNSRSGFMRMIWQEQINDSSIPVNCNICKIELPNSVDLHGHLAGHFSKDFTDQNHDNPRNDAMDIDDSGKNKSSTKSLTNSVSTDSIYTLASEGENFHHPKAEIPSGKQLMKYIESGTPNHTPKRLNINKIMKILNFDNDDIYRMSDKLRELEIGMKLSYETFFKKRYCLVCRKTTEFTIENYYEHLCSLDHCVYLERMERDHASFAKYPEQFSEIALGLEYMEEISKDHVLCHACETRMSNDDDILRKHIDDKSHARYSCRMGELSMKHFERVKLPINCDWYKVERYHCVPCLMTFGSEVNFFEHMTSNDHLCSWERPVNKKRQLIYDFCESCALLWYGYRRTCAYHRSIDTHLFLMHDGYYLSTELPKSAKELLAMPELYINETMRIYEESMAEKREKEDLLIHDMELAVGRKYCRARAYMFGSRVTGMGSLDCDVDVFLDCGDMYNGKMESSDMTMNTIMDDVSECLNQEAKSWIVEELVKKCRSPIIRAHHRPTGLSCDISFENGLAVENTNLIKSYNDAYPLCREMIIFLKRWLIMCKLAGSELITSYALYWHVIFYLQHETILPSVEELIKIKNQSRTVDGWEVGATRDFTHNLASSDFTIRQLLTGFYDFWSKFDHRYDVACPMIGKILKKRVFLDFTIMTDNESFYGDHVKKSMEREALRIDSPMCLQDPFDLSHNITKAVGKVYVNRFRKYCSYSLDLLLRS